MSNLPAIRWFPPPLLVWLRFQIVKQIKETHCYVAYDERKEESMEIDRNSDDRNMYNLPDGRSVQIGAARFRAPEALFDPMLIGDESVGAFPHRKLTLFVHGLACSYCSPVGWGSFSAPVARAFLPTSNPNPPCHAALYAVRAVAGIHEVLVNSVQKSDMDLRRTLWSNIVLSGGSTLFEGFGPRMLKEVKKLAPKDIRIKISAPQDRIFTTWSGGSILAGLATFKNIWVTKQEWEEKGEDALRKFPDS